MRRVRRPATRHRGRQATAQACRSRWRREPADSGVMAIVLAVVLVGVIIPVTAFGVTTYLKSGLAAELQRSADAGALAGAATIPLADTGALKTFVATHLSGVGSTAALIPPSWCSAGAAESGLAITDPAAPGTCPLDTACKTALDAISADWGYGTVYAKPYGLPSCQARYADDSAFFANLQGCLSTTAGNLLDLTNVPTLDTLLPPILNSLVGQTTGLITQTNVLGFASILPALLKPGVTVTLRELTRGPLDSLNPGDTGSAGSQAKAATARRAFKNLVVVPRAGANNTVSGALALSMSQLQIPVPYDAPQLGPDTLIDLNPTAALTSATAISTLNQLNTIVGTLDPACTGVIGSLSTDLADILNPQSSGAPTAGQILADAGTNASPVVLVVIPTNLTTFTQIPFLDFVPACLNQLPGNVPDSTTADIANVLSPGPLALPAGISSVGSCTLAAPGIFRGRLVR